MSDLHLDGPGEATDAAFLRLLHALPPSATLVVLGDAFHAWWTLGGEPFGAYAATARALLDFNLVYLPGNHDFHAPAYFGARGATTCRTHHPGASLHLRLGKLHAHLSHGDEVDTSPGYRALHAVLRGAPFDRAIQALGEARAWSLLHRLAGDRQHVSRHDPTGTPPLVEGQRARAQHLVNTEGFDLVAMGHTHAPELRPVGGGQFLNTGDWVAHRTYATVHGDRVELQRFDG